MTYVMRFVASALALAMCGMPLVAAAAGSDPIQKYCSAQTKSTYGFQCQGYSNVGAGLEPVTFVGTASGSTKGVFDARGVFNSSQGSNHVHAVGQAVFQDSTCFGHIQYQQSLVLPDGTEIDLHSPLDIDFATVDNASEILGTVSATLPGATGDLVPRMSCRLVRVHG